jgi:hypothetical protein
MLTSTDTYIIKKGVAITLEQYDIYDFMLEPKK